MEEAGCLAPINKLAKEQMQRLSDFANSYSLVFDNDRNGDCVFFGDADLKAIERIKGDFYPNYRVVKAAHHGTSTHYSPAIPKSEYVFILFGENRRCQIDEAYPKTVSVLSFGRSIYRPEICCPHFCYENQTFVVSSSRPSLCFWMALAV